MSGSVRPNPTAQAMFTPPADLDAALGGAVNLVWAIGCTAKFLWPIPDRGCGHIPQVEQPEITTRSVPQFLAG